MINKSVLKAFLAFLLTAIYVPCINAQEKGDLNNDGTVSISDVTTLIDYLLSGVWPGEEPSDTTVVVDDSKLTFNVNGIEFNMIKVEGGTFVMGSANGDTNEGYPHAVELSTYYIAETEVTQELYQAVMGSNPSAHVGNKYPVEKVSWSNANNFAKKLSELTGKSFSLPTEAQWEFAAIGGNKSNGYTYSGSNTIGSVAWYSGNSGNATHEVATKAPNELGIYDMSGNVMEWVYDNYEEQYPNTSLVQIDPTGPSSYTGEVVIRNGAYSSPAYYLRNTRRIGMSPWYTEYGIVGFRMVLKN